ncbi:MAG: hypothetical protein HN826_09355 [Methylococcales bacterium]|jgi:hypothetical protein|nr:hypothetical protein [Methylococcales bacterium]
MSQHLLDNGLTIDCKIPIGWQVLESIPQTIFLNEMNLQNDHLFRLLMHHNDHQTATLELDKQSHHPDLSLLELKVDVLIGLMSEWIKDNKKLPDKNKVWLNANGMEWQSNSLPKLNQQVLVSLYLSQRIPSPICFIGKIDCLRERDNQTTATINFENLEENIQNSLDKYIFSQHRRAIARQKMNPQKPSKR